MSPRAGTCRHVVPLIDPLVDGTLDDERVCEVLAHLRACAACESRREATAAVVKAAAELPTLDPPPELWARIDARLVEDGRVTPPRPSWWWRWQELRRPVLAGASLVAVAAALVLALNLRRPPSELAASAPASTATAAAPDLMAEALAEVDRAEEGYRRAVAELADLVSRERGRWRPDVASSYDRNLALIDQAVARQREAVRGQPMDLDAQEVLHAAYRRQIDFMQEALVRGEGPL